MSIATQISALQADKTAIANAITAKGGTVNSGDGFDDFATDIGTIPTGSTPTISSLTVTPSTTTQTFNSSSVDGYKPVTVNAVTSSIDSNITAGNIKKDVQILGVTGTYEGSGGGACNSTHVNCCINQYGVPSMISPMQAASSSLAYATLKPFATTTTNTSPNYSYVNYTDGTDVLSTVPSVTLMGENTIKQLILPNLTHMEARLACENFTNLEKVDLSNLESGSISRMFKGCTALTDINLSKLSNIAYTYALGGSNAQGGTFSGCTSLTTLSFPSLTSTSFGSYTNQFNAMLKGVTGCTVHFPSNLQSVIGSWSSVTSGFGGTNTTVLFDLPATS